MPEQQLQFSDHPQLVELRRAWERAVITLAGSVNRLTYESYIRPIRPVSFDGSQVVLGVANAFAREWLDKRYSSLIRDTLQSILGRPIELKIEVATIEERSHVVDLIEPKLAVTVERPKAKRHPIRLSDDHFSIPLNERYQLGRFVTGKSNRLAHAAAVSVATEPGSHYNPLFLYGGPGLGKTHLLHGIARGAKEANPGLSVCLVDGEGFTHQFVTALREKKMEEFRNYYRGVDLWLVDDVQFIAGRESTKEEFFHTFNTLYQASKQIVLASDRSPRELRTMDERLRSRFECGLMCDIAKPELETRIAILQQRCTEEGWEIPAEVLFYVASAIQSNFRAIEGAITKLIAYASIMRCEIDHELAQDVLGEYFITKALPEANRKGISILTIQHAVASHFEQSVEALKGQRRTHEVSHARQVAMFLCREMTHESLSTIGAAFGGRDHTTVQRSIAKVESQLPHDSDVSHAIESLRKKLEG